MHINSRVRNYLHLGGGNFKQIKRIIQLLKTKENVKNKISIINIIQGLRCRGERHSLGSAKSTGVHYVYPSTLQTILDLSFLNGEL